MEMNQSIRLTSLTLHARVISMKCLIFKNQFILRVAVPLLLLLILWSHLSPRLTPFMDSDFILEEIDTFLARDDSISPKIDDGFFDPEGDIHPPELELKDLPPHLEYAFLEGTCKLPVIITKYLKREEKDQLINVLKSHKRVIAWKISDIQGIDPNFCTHKILMEDDFKPVVQHQRR
ncbi:hypothetical protein Tco_0193008, partial [Tanacetum coccineum]